MNLIFVGPPGSGKGTQAKIIARILDLPHISTGDLVRETTGDLKREIDLYINTGHLVPDELMLKILQKRLSHEDVSGGFIFDGFPRNMAQVDSLDPIVKIDKVVHIAIPDKEAFNRISGRRNCPKCGRIYNIYTSPKPLQEGICDYDESILYERGDQREEVIEKRLNVYHKDTEPILKKYPHVDIDGSKDIDDVTQDILKYISK